MDADMVPAVEIFLRLLDCQICGCEINPGREKKIGRTRVCPPCYEQLNKGGRKRQK